jgi:TRAP transporter 4TM/12TM fusion protein
MQEGLECLDMTGGPKDEESSRRRILARPWSQLVFGIGLVMTGFHIIVLTIYPLDPFLFRVAHLTFATVLIFLLRPFYGNSPQHRPSAIDFILCLLSVSVLLYVNHDLQGLAWRSGVDPTSWDVVFGIIMLVLLLEATRRIMGWFLPALALLFIAYAVGGANLPGILGNPGFSFARTVSVLFGVQGVYGIPLHISATYAFLFILFGHFLANSGSGDFFIKVAFALTGRKRGGPAKAAVVASALFGTISGSACANVVSTGAFTIPLMKRVGYKPYFAGAVEACSSTGGQIMPPVMGSAAFILAEFTGVGYDKIIIYAAIPALLYFTTIYFMLDFEALSLGLLGIPRKSLPPLWGTVKYGFHLFTPLILLVYMLLIHGASPILSALVALAGTIVASWVRSDTRMGPRKIIRSAANGPLGVLEVATACGTAGILIGVLTMTGLGLKFVSLLLNLSGNHLLILLILTMVVCIILGMGMPTPAAFILCASVAASAMVQAGAKEIPANFFILYFACLSTITPPVALAAYAASGLAGADPMKVGWTAVRLGIAAYIIPYMFVYSPALLMMGNWSSILLSAGTAAVGCYALARGVQFRVAPALERVLLIASSLFLITPGLLTDGIGVLLLAAGLLIHRSKPGSGESKESHSSEHE